MASTRCTKIGCTRRRSHTLRAFLYAAPGTVPAEVSVDLQLCLEHAEAIEATDIFFPGTGWDHLVARFRKLGKAAPRLDLIEIEPVPLGGSAPIEE